MKHVSSVTLANIHRNIQKLPAKILSLDASLGVRLNIYIRMFSVLYICYRYLLFLCIGRLSYRVKDVKTRFCIPDLERFMSVHLNTTKNVRNIPLASILVSNFI